jgi:hypothetical protein
MKRTPFLAITLCSVTFAGGCYIRDTVMQGQKAMRDIEAMKPDIEKRKKEVDELTNPAAAPVEQSSFP